MPKAKAKTEPTLLIAVVKMIHQPAASQGRPRRMGESPLEDAEGESGRDKGKPIKYNKMKANLFEFVTNRIEEQSKQTSSRHAPKKTPKP